MTEAEKFGNAAVFDFNSGQWSLVEGATYLYPQGKNGPAAPEDHPATQVSWNDAVAFAKWKGKRLPTQSEWEHAAKNAENTTTLYSWGKDLFVDGVYRANTWQGSFPYHNTLDDGYLTTSPVGKFGKSKLGLTDMGGNVWQWCEDSIAPTPHEALTDTTMRKVTPGG